MASVVNTSTLELRRSVNTPEYVAPWVVVTESSAGTISAIAQRYRKWVTDHVEEMTQGEKDAVDAAAVVSRNTGLKAAIQTPTDLAAFALLLLDELNVRTAAFNALRAGIAGANNLADAKAAAAAISDLPTYTKAQMRTAWENKVDSLNGGGF